MTALFAAILPAVVAASAVGVGRAAGGKVGACAAASAVGLAYAAGHFGVARPAFPPAEVTDRIPWIALAAAALAVVEAINPPGRIRTYGGRAVLAGLTLVFILGPAVDATGLSKNIAASGIAALAAWVNLEALATDPERPGVARSLLVSAAGAGLVLLLSGSAILGFLGIAAASAIAGAWLGSWSWDGPRAGYVPASAAVLTALVLYGYVYSSVSTPCALLLAVAPASAWVVRIGPARRLGPWASATIGTVAAIVPVGIAVGLALASSSTSEY